MSSIINGVGGGGGGGNPVVETIANASPITLHPATNDMGVVAALSQTTTINSTGTPVEGKRYVLRITSVASQTLTKGSNIRDSADNPWPPATTGSGKDDYLSFIGNAVKGTLDLSGRTFAF